MKTIRPKHVLCAVLFTALLVSISGCSMSPVNAQGPVAINSMVFGSSDLGLPSSATGTTIFIQTRTNDPINTDAYSIPMPGHAVLSHLHFATMTNTLNSAVATISVYVNGAPSVISCNAAASQVVCSDTTNSVRVNEGDLVTIGMTVATTSSTNSGGVGPWRASVGIAFQ